MSALDAYLQESRAELDRLSDQGLLRRLRLPRGVDLVSNDYLGLAAHPLLVDRMAGALREVGAGAAGSRLLRGHHAVFDEIEARLAEFTGAESSLVFSSGYSANLGLLTTLLTSDDLVLSDERNHASLIDGIRLSGARKRIYPHQDLNALDLALRKPRSGRAVIVTESVFSMDGDLTPIDEIVALAERHDALVVVDEAHATGLYGARGSGRVEELGLRERVLATIHTGGKALGSGGAWVSGPGTLRDMLINRARSFVFSTAPIPVLAAALDAAIDLVRDEPDRRAEVHRKSALLRESLIREGIPVSRERSPIVPIIVGGNDASVALQEGLGDSGFDARAVRPPAVPPGAARLRVTVRYPLPEADLLRFVREVKRRYLSAAKALS
ncbi:MAG: 8-amino-7-oxononanoate synthase [Vicinamibacteria bacterium]|nr:8-amino-7-oxononanoate synthase [Vicinamibacteria bacterium]